MRVDVVEKVAETSSERHRLRCEAATLRAIAHPGVVRLLSATDDSITLSRVGGTTLSEMPARSEEFAVAWGAALCTTVSDLHDVGCVHTAISAEHVILDQDGHPVLCGFGNALWPTDAAARAALALADRNAIVAMIAERLDQAESTPRNVALRADRRLRRLLVARRRRRLRRSGSDLRELAKSLATGAEASALTRSQRGLPSRRHVKRLQMIQLPEAQPLVGTRGPEAQPLVGTRQRRSISAKACKVAGAACILVTTGVLGTIFIARAMTSPLQQVSRAVQTVTVIGPSGPLELLAGSPGAISISAGRWHCGDVAPAVLQVATGRIWVFPSWPPPAQREVGRLVARVTGAISLSRASSPGGCDTLMATTRSGQSLPVATGPSRSTTGPSR